MSTGERVAIGKLSTGVPGLDIILGGGLPEYSLNLVAGTAGTGKTTLVQQIVFANASPERRAVVITALGEPPLKMLRYQQQFSFFDIAKVESAVRFVNVNEGILRNDLDALLETILLEAQSAASGIVVIDSFRALVRAGAANGRTPAEMESFMQRLTLDLMSLKATIFFVGEYIEVELQQNPIVTLVDGILWHQQAIERNSSIRKIQIMKLRGQCPMPGLHTFRITTDGVEIFPRLPVSTRCCAAASSSATRSSSLALRAQARPSSRWSSSSTGCAGARAVSSRSSRSSPSVTWIGPGASASISRR
jgi:circadian clock protein KaiC